MATITRNEEQNTITVKLDDYAAFQTFQQGIEDRRQWTRHPDTRELSDIIANNAKSSNVIVQFQDTYLPVKQLNRY